MAAAYRADRSDFLTRRVARSLRIFDQDGFELVFIIFREDACEGGGPACCVARASLV